MAVETDRLIVVFEAQVKAFERAVKSLNTTTAREFARLRSTINAGEAGVSRAAGRAGAAAGRAFSQGFGRLLSGTLTTTLLFAIKRAGAASLTAAAEAGSDTAGVYVDAFSRITDKVLIELGNRIAETLKTTINEAHGIMSTIDRTFKTDFEPQDLKDLVELGKNPPKYQTEAMKDAAKDYDQARESLRKYIDELEAEAQESEQVGLAKAKLIALHRTEGVATDAERQYIEELTEEIYENEKAIEAREAAQKAAEEAAKERAQILEDAYKDLAGAAEDFTTSLVTGLAEGADAADVLKASLQDLGRMLIQLGIRTAFSAGGSGLGLPGFQHGGAFTVGGAGGVDSQMVAFRATPGERVSIHPPGMAASSRGSGGIHMGGISISVQGSADERTLSIMERRITQAQAQQMRAIERNFGRMSNRYSSLRG